MSSCSVRIGTPWAAIAVPKQCLNEWKRLGVPDSIAGEMAADLAADLEEAEAEGASPEDVLGNGAFDPSAFAAAWAAERGVIERTLATRPPGLMGRSRQVAAIGTLALILAVVGAALVIAASPSAPNRLAFAPAADPALAASTGRVYALPPAALWEGRRVVTQYVPAPGVRIVAVDTEDSGIDGRTVGAVLLIVGLAGLVPATLFVLWLGPRRGRSAGSLA